MIVSKVNSKLENYNYNMCLDELKHIMLLLRISNKQSLIDSQHRPERRIKRPLIMHKRKINLLQND